MKLDARIQVESSGKSQERVTGLSWSLHMLGSQESFLVIRVLRADILRLGLGAWES